ncbi:mirror-image polydactyly gene 1 protein isoform X2 [Solea solea]|uniref:mirror-image polydactyly gene 1 protein isoform X2 n=1 Tax=Solea solea TaxID=90069 RepID=UPI00272AC4C1|nr:mirror-image polydactyly gene 1 protein isoform X2 [Solea solea]
MYTANPRVNAELQQRLPSPVSPSPIRSEISLSVDHSEDLLSSSSVFPIRRCPAVMQGEVSSSRGRGRDVSDGGERGVLDDSFPQDVSSGRQSSVWNKNVSFLLKEVDTLRDANNKLQEQLLQKEEELQRRMVEEELREELVKGSKVVLDKVLSSQKDRDHALMSRLLLANEERDEALLRIQRLQHTTQSERVNVDAAEMEVDELLQCVCDAHSVQQVEQFGSVLVERLKSAQQRRNDITAQEMKAVMEEREGCVNKCKRLEQDLNEERVQRRSQEELLRVQTERDSDLDERRRLEVELQALRANHSPQNLTVSPPSSSAHGDSLEAPPLLVQLEQLSQEKQRVEAELKRCQEVEQEANERVHRLERLVEVLRKKVGTGSVRAVI